MGMKREVSIDGVQYNSISDAGRALELSYGMVKGRLSTKKWIDWNYVDAKEPGDDASGVVKRPVVIYGITYASTARAAFAHNLQLPTVTARLNSKSDKYKDWTFEDLNVNVKSTVSSAEAKELISSDSRGDPIPIIIYGVVYASSSVAGDILNISRGVVRHRVLSTLARWDDWSNYNAVKQGHNSSMFKPL